MRSRTVACIVIALTTLVACDQVTVTAQWNPPLLSLHDESPAGIYLGVFTDTSGTNPLVQPVTAIIDRDGNTQLIFALAAERHVAGRVDVDGDRLTGTLVEYSGAVTSFTGVGGVSAFRVHGSVSTGAGMTGEYEAETHAGRFTLEYETAYDTPSSFGQAAGIWSFSRTSSGVVYTVTWDIDDDGLLFGVDTLGCVFVGRVNVIDEHVNAYGLAVQVESCGYFNGDYAGQAFLLSGAGQDADWLTLAMANDVFAFATVLQGQSPP
jgi:hypothetical protein